MRIIYCEFVPPGEFVDADAVAISANFKNILRKVLTNPISWVIVEACNETSELDAKDKQMIITINGVTYTITPDSRGNGYHVSVSR